MINKDYKKPVDHTNPPTSLKPVSKKHMSHYIGRLMVKVDKFVWGKETNETPEPFKEDQEWLAKAEEELNQA